MRPAAVSANASNVFLKAFTRATGKHRMLLVYMPFFSQLEEFFSVNWKEINERASEQGRDVGEWLDLSSSYWMLALPLAFYGVLSGGPAQGRCRYGQLGFFSIHVTPLWSSRKISTGGPERFLFAAISAKIMLRTNVTGSSCSKSGFLDRKSSIAWLGVCIK